MISKPFSPKYTKKNAKKDGQFHGALTSDNKVVRVPGAEVNVGRHFKDARGFSLSCILRVPEIAPFANSCTFPTTYE